MSASPPPLALQVRDFPGCPPEFAPTLEALLGHLARHTRDVSEALTQLERGPNVQGGYVTATGDSDALGVLVVTARSPLQTPPRAVWVAQLRTSDGGDVPQLWGMSGWRLMSGGMLRLTLQGLAASTRYTVTGVVE